MKPYDEKFIIEKIKEYNEKIENNKKRWFKGNNSRIYV